METTCKNCVFWKHTPIDRTTRSNRVVKREVDPKAGKCQRSPEYVDRAETDWCGEWADEYHPRKIYQGRNFW
jgi:hypothetical protein